MPSLPTTTRRQINLGTWIGALILFFFPWIEVQCQDQRVLTQSGVQVVYGGASLDEQIESMAEDDRDNDNDIRFSLLTLLAFGCVVAGCVLAWKRVEQFDGLQVALSAAALACLVFLMLVGFPVERQVRKANKESRGETGGMVVMSTERKPWLYLTVLAVAGPLILRRFSDDPTPAPAPDVTPAPPAPPVSPTPAQQDDTTA